MQVSLSPSAQRYNIAQSQPSFGVNVLDSVMKNEKKSDIFQPKTEVVKERTMTEKEKTEINAKRVKTAVKCLVGAVLFADILYFAMKRNFKVSKVAMADKKVEQVKKIIPPPVIIPKPFDAPIDVI